jgi:hypothetical protein
MVSLGWIIGAQRGQPPPQGQSGWRWRIVSPAGIGEKPLAGNSGAGVGCRFEAVSREADFSKRAFMDGVSASLAPP